MDRGAWQATVHGVTKSQTQLNKHKNILLLAPRDLGGLFHPALLLTFLYFLGCPPFLCQLTSNHSNPVFFCSHPLLVLHTLLSTSGSVPQEHPWDAGVSNVCAWELSCFMSDPLRPYCLEPASLCPRDSPGKNTGVGCHVLLQGIFLTYRLNPHLCRSDLWLCGEPSHDDVLSLVLLQVTGAYPTPSVPGDCTISI